MNDLVDLIAYGMYEEAREKFQKGVSVDAVDDDLPLLIYAVMFDWPGVEDFAIWLLERGADATATTDQGRTALHEAARMGLSKVVQRLLEVAPRIAGFKDDTGKTALHLTTNAETARLLLDAGADVAGLDNGGESPVVNAVKNPACLRLLLERGADPNLSKRTNQEHQYYEGWTALHEAVERKSQDSTAMLVAAGADVDATTRWCVTPLHLAVLHRLVDAVALLLDSGANPCMEYNWNFSHWHGLSDIATCGSALDLGKNNENIALLLEKASRKWLGDLPQYQILRRDSRWLCLLRLASLKVHALRTALDEMTLIVIHANQLVFGHPAYKSRSRYLGFALKMAEEELGEREFFDECVRHAELHEAIGVFVRAVITQNERCGQIYVHEELEAGTHAIRAMLHAAVGGALDLYETFLSSIEIDHTVEHLDLIQWVLDNHPEERVEGIKQMAAEAGFSD